MSYDLYCYRPMASFPDATEAEALVEGFNAVEEAGKARSTSTQLQEQIAAALIAYNPRLERYQFDYGKIAESLKVTEQDARLRYSHIELNTPEGDDLTVQLTLYGDHVDITIPYWYEGNKANEVFSAVSGYLRVIRRTAGFFVYDPQTGAAFDPDATEIRDHPEYDRVVKDLPLIAANAVKAKRPWWKFW
jgi:hypothetical protein